MTQNVIRFKGSGKGSSIANFGHSQRVSSIRQTVGINYILHAFNLWLFALSGAIKSQINCVPFDPHRSFAYLISQPVPPFVALLAVVVAQDDREGDELLPASWSSL